MSPLQTMKCTVLCVLIESRNEITIKKAVKNEAKKPKVTPKVKKAISKAPAQKAKKDAAPAKVRYISVKTSVKETSKKKKKQEEEDDYEEGDKDNYLPGQIKATPEDVCIKDVFTF